MIVKDLELHFEVAYDYNTVMKKRNARSCEAMS